ncbi:MAG: hypothetical protein FWH44_06300 [Methanomassiliicoccaceae archaeon]|nr:hypothetical protein [Methanomassiliicoccaceae archaeon]
MDYDDIIDGMMSNNIPEIALAVGGILAVLIAILYIKSRDSFKYKLMMLIGAVFGAVMAVIAFNTYGIWAVTTSIIMAVSAFTLIIRPFRDVHFALLIALMVMVVVYLLLGGLAGTKLEIISEGWPRAGLAFFCGAMVYMMLHMIEAIVKIAGKVMNAWPVLLILGLVCIAEAVMVFAGYGSVYDWMRSFASDNAAFFAWAR